MKSSLRKKTILAVLAITAVLLHGLVFLHTSSNPEVLVNTDSKEYLLAGHNLIASGELYAGDLQEQIYPALYSRRPPMYPLLTGLCRRISESLLLISLVQIGIGFFGGFLLWLILGFLSVPIRLRLLVLSLFLFYPAQIFYSHLVMSEVLFQFFLLAAVFSVTCFLRSRRGAFLGLANLSLALAVLTKPVLVYFWLPNLLFVAWIAWQSSSKALVLWAAVPILTVSLWSYRNYEKTGYFHFSSVKTSAMYSMTVREYRPTGDGPPGKETHAGSFAQKSREIEAAYLSYRLKNWPLTVQRYFAGGLAFFLDPGRFDIDQFLGRQSDIQFSQISRLGLAKGLRRFLASYPNWMIAYLGAVGLFNLLVTASFLFFVAKARCPQGFKPFLLLVVGYVIAVTGTIGASRYRVGVEPLLLVTIPFAWAQCSRWWRRGTPDQQAGPPGVTSGGPEGDPHVY